jgi:hypothetical protein
MTWIAWELSLLLCGTALTMNIVVAQNQAEKARNGVLRHTSLEADGVNGE